MTKTNTDLKWTFDEIWPETVPHLEPDDIKYKPADMVLRDEFPNPAARGIASAAYIIAFNDLPCGGLRGGMSSLERHATAFNEAMEALGYTEWKKEAA